MKSKVMKKIWPWNIQCGQYKMKVMLGLDAKSQGRLEYFLKSRLFLIELFSLSSNKFHSKKTDTHKSQYG